MATHRVTLHLRSGINASTETSDAAKLVAKITKFWTGEDPPGYITITGSPTFHVELESIILVEVLEIEDT